MKKGKKLLSVLLCAVMILGIAPGSYSADNVENESSGEFFDAEVKTTARCDGKELRVNAKMTNTGNKNGILSAYKVVWNKNDEVVKTAVENIPLEQGESKTCMFSADYDESQGQYAKIYIWEKSSNRPFGEAASSKECDRGSFEGKTIEINTATVFASKESESNHNAAFAADGNMETYWSAKNVTENDPQYITAVFDNVYDVTRAGIAFGLGGERRYDFSVEASLDGAFYQTVVDRQLSELTDDVVYYNTAFVKAKYIRFAIYGKETADDENWIRVTEIEACGYPCEEDEYAANLLDGNWSVRAMTEYNQDYTPTLGKLLYGESGDELHIYDGVGRDGKITNMVNIKSVTASQTPEAENKAENVIDNNLETKWTAENVGETTPAELLIELEEGSSIDTLKIAFGEGKSRTHVFKAEVMGNDGKYITVIEKRQAEKTDAVQTYTFERTEAKCIKLTFYGRVEAESGWVQVAEAQPCDSYVMQEGAGAVLMGKNYEVTPDRGKYNISFDINIPSKKDNGEENDPYWSGFSLTNAWLSGGGDSGSYTAMQLRFEKSDGKVKIKKLTSNRFNEGSLKDFFTTTFNMDTDIHFSLDVDPKTRKIDIVVSDGVRAAKRYIYFSYDNDERTRPSTWTGHEARWLLFNSGAGAKNEYFVKNITVTQKPNIYSYADENSLGMAVIDESTVDFAAILDKGYSYEGSLGEKLYGEIAEPPAESGIRGKAVHLYDSVGRETDSINGAGGAGAFIKFNVPDGKNAYKVDFTMYAPVSDEYGGFSLGTGKNNAVGDGEYPYAAQLRFRPSEDGIKFAAYNSEKFNEGNLDDLVGKYTPIAKAVPWHISVTVNPRNYTINMSIDDGVNLQTNKTKSFCGSSSVWVSGRKIDTLMINTGIGGNGDIYVGDIKVTDLGSPLLDIADPLNGVIRLLARNGTGKYMHHNGDVTVDFQEKQTLDYTRFVERGGLMGEGTVSFEAMNKPGYFLTIMPGDDNIIQLKPYEDTVRFKANSSFRKEKIGGSTRNVIYSTYRDPNKYLYDNSGSAAAWSMHDYNRICYYVKSETGTVVGDDFKNGFRWDEWIPGYAYNQKWDGGTLLSYHNHSGVARSTNIVVENGVCLLKATKESAHIGDKWGIDYNSYNFYDENGNHKKWTSFAGYVGVLTARRSSDSGMTDPYKFNKNCLIEGSFKQPVGARGYWTAFWLTGDSWPPEIDIFEYMSRYGGGTFYSNIHRSTSQSEGREYHIRDGSLQTRFHTYSLDWGDGFIDYYFDGTWFKRATGDIATFQNNCHLIINTGLGGWEYEPNNQTVWDTGLQVDWVRAYQW